jgi:hypothetical protein
MKIKTVAAASLAAIPSLAYPAFAQQGDGYHLCVRPAQHDQLRMEAPDRRTLGLDHGIDLLGDEVQPEELNKLERGNQYGWRMSTARAISTRSRRRSAT